MALVLANRVRETTTTTGTGTVTLAGAVTGYQSFSAVGNANTTYYTISGQGTSEWEVGIGTYTSAGTTLARTTVLASSNAGSAVNFSAGTKDVFVTYPSSKAVYLDASGNASALGTPASGTVTNLTGTASININGTVGATTATTGAFTTLSATSTLSTTGGALKAESAASQAKSVVGAFNAGTAAATTAELITFAQAGTQKISHFWANSLTAYQIQTLASGAKIQLMPDTGGTVVASVDSTGLAVTGTLSATGDVSFTGTGTQLFQGTHLKLKNDDAKIVAYNAANAYVISIGTRQGWDGTGGTTNAALGTVGTLNIYTGGSSTASLSIASGAAAAVTIPGTLASGATTITGTLNVAGTTKVTSGTLAANSAASVFAVGTDTQDYVKGYFTGTVNGTAGGAFAVGVGFFGTFDSGSTTYGSSFYSAPNTAAASFTMAQAAHFWIRNWNKGASSAITNQYGILIDDQTGASSNTYGIQSNVNSGSNKWNIHAAGTANNHFAGAIRQGSANPEQVAGTQSNSSFLTTSAVWALALLNNGATPYGLGIAHNTDSNNTGNEFLYCTGAGTLRMSVRSNGGIANVQANDVNTSDVRLKKNIELAGNYLDKICAIPVKTFLYKDQTDAFLNLGVIAQDVESVAPELIDSGGFGETPEDGVPLKSIYQTDLQYALMKAIQELAAKVAKLEAA